MRRLYLLRHSLTAANEKRLYSGSVDLPLSPAGRALAESTGKGRPLPDCECYVSSGMRRATETLFLLTGHAPDAVLPDLREMNFGAFELRSYDDMLKDADFIRWIEDPTGEVRCPGGECANGFRARVLRGGTALLALPHESVLAVCHGGTIVNLMQAWFPDVQRHFYEWQPRACGGYGIDIDGMTPVHFEDLEDAT